MRIGIVGNGVVGHATARVFMETHEVRCWDLLSERCTHSLHETTLGCDLVFVCLPTPQKERSLECCNLSAIEYFFCGLQEDCSEKNLVLRSTVPIGTTRRLAEKYGLKNLAHSPEFLTARCSVTDAMTPSRLVFGSPYWKDGCCREEDGQISQVLWKLYEDRFPGVPVHMMSSDESEAVKLFTNGFFATKVAYFNEVNLLSERLGLDWGTVLAGMLSDGRIAHSHTQVPGPDGQYGFGGACLPKDLAMLVNHLGPEGVQEVLDDEGARRVGYGSVATVCWAALQRNDLDRERKS